jgi:hypothetical protein
MQNEPDDIQKQTLNTLKNIERLLRVLVMPDDDQTIDLPTAREQWKKMIDKRRLFGMKGKKN